LPAFADLEQEQVEQAKLEDDETDATSAAPQQQAAVGRRGHGRAALRKYVHGHSKSEAGHVAGHKPAAKHQAKGGAHPAKDKRKRA
jgi:hypothetical protein